jgi:hypothetical protein
MEMASLASGLPQRLDRVLKTVERGDIEAGVNRHVYNLQRLVKSTAIRVVVAAVVLGLALFFVGYKLGH